VLLRYVVAGGKYVTTVLGAVPNEIPEVAVPPEISLLVPGTARAGLNQVVVSVNTVEVVDAATAIYSPV
jgi:hypothetical protein